MKFKTIEYRFEQNSLHKVGKVTSWAYRSEVNWPYNWSGTEGGTSDNLINLTNFLKHKNLDQLNKINFVLVPENLVTRVARNM